jgi:phospholipid/cholesterol/gamma-HCH transport system substrate-binding protein
MKSRAYALLTGLFIVVLCGVVAVIAIWFSGRGGETKPYQIVSHTSISGLVEGANVYFLGVPAGEVTSIQLAKNRPRTVLINIAVAANAHITHSTYAKLILRGITGQSEVELSYIGNNRKPLRTSAEHPARIPLKPSLLGTLSSSGEHLLAELDQLGAKLNRIVNKRTRAHIQHLLAHADQATGELVTLERNLNRTAATLPALSQSMRHALARIDGLSNRANRLLASLNQFVQHGIKLTGTGQKLGHTALHRTLPQLNQTLQELQQTSASIKKLAHKFENNPQGVIAGPSQVSPGPGEKGHEGPPKR